MTNYEELKNHVERDYAWAKEKYEEYRTTGDLTMSSFYHGQMLAYKGVLSKIEHMEKWS